MKRPNPRVLFAVVVVALLFAGRPSLYAETQQGSDWTLEPLLPRGDDPDPATIVDQNDFMSSASADGKLVVFTSGRSGSLCLYSMKTDGSQQRRISCGPGPQLQASFSPDGKRIVFVQREAKEKYLVVMKADGSDRHRIDAPLGSWPIPAWSPDGKRILYNSPTPEGDDDLFTIGPDGEGPERLLGSPKAERHASWSPDGSRVVFASRRDGNDYELYVAKRSGGDWTRLTDNDVDDHTPSWSPSGDQIVFQSERRGQWTILVVAPDGSGERALTDYPMQYDPVWSYDGTQIFFNSDRDGRRGIYVMSAEGALPRKLTNTEASSFVTVVRKAGVDIATRLFRKAHAATPDAVYFYEREVESLGENFLEMGFLDSAKTLFEVNVEAYPESRKTWTNLASARYAAGDVRGAIECYEHVMKIEAEYLGPFDLGNDQISKLISQLKGELQASR